MARKAHLYRSVMPLIYEPAPDPHWQKDVDNRVFFGITWGLQHQLIKSLDPVVVIQGYKHGSGFTNTVRVMFASDGDCMAACRR